MAVDAVQIQRRLITVDEYEQMIQAGVFREDDRLELIEGDILQMSPIGSAHAALVTRLSYSLMDRLRSQAIVFNQNPIRLARSEPQPDLALLLPKPDFYASRLPGPDDILLLIEVADTTVIMDRTLKIPLYGRNGVRESWLVDLSGQAIELYRSPASGGYLESVVARPGTTIAPLAFPSVLFRVAEILGLE